MHAVNSLKSQHIPKFLIFSPFFPIDKMSTASGADEFVVGNIHPNGVAIITLNRPKALNAVNFDMQIEYKCFLDEWEEDPRVKCVLIESSSPGLFCADILVDLTGGDLKQIIKKHKLSDAIELFMVECSLLCKISEYKKPYISLMDGITMGLGIALSGHGRYRIITERTRLAMPENGIGLFPNVGFSHMVAKCPGEGTVGAYLGMTGKKISNPADALYVGLGTHYVPSRNLGSLKDSLLASTLSDDPHHDVAALVSRYSIQPDSEPHLKLLLPYIASTFDANKSVSEIFVELKRNQQSSDDMVLRWANEALEGLGKGAPFAHCLTHDYFAKIASGVRNNDPEQSKLSGVMKLEYRIFLRTSQREDFTEGVRAMLVDKDQKPKWKPSRVEEVDPQEVESIFEPLEPSIPELRFKWKSLTSKI